MKNFLNKTRLLSATIAVGGLLFGLSLAVQPASAQIDKGLKTVEQSSVSKKSPDVLIKDIVNIMLYIVGIIAVIMLILGGIKYATSAGDSAKVTSAKNTIIYSIVGLIIAIFAYAIVNWVYRSVT